jgi:hypothetical protein
MNKKSILLILLLSFLINPLSLARRRGGYRRRGGISVWFGSRPRYYRYRRVPRYRRRYYRRDWAWGVGSLIGGLMLHAMIADAEHRGEATSRLDKAYIVKEFNRLQNWVNDKLDKLDNEIRSLEPDEKKDYAKDLRKLRILMLNRIKVLDREVDRVGSLSRKERSRFHKTLNSLRRITEDKVNAYIRFLE